MESDATAGSLAGEIGNSEIQVNVKFAGESIAVNISPNSKVEELKSVLLPLTNVLPRCQKLIHKGRILSDESPLSSYGIINKSKIMVMATVGLHQGDAPMKKEAGSVGDGIGIGIQRVVSEQKKVKENPSFDESQVEGWQITGVISLPECNLTEIPDEVWHCGDSLRFLDVSRNSIESIHPRIGLLSTLEELVLDSNDLREGLIGWTGLVSLPFLRNLSLQHNRLRTLPSRFGALTSLKKLDISYNYIFYLPTEISSLRNLVILDANNNSLTTLPSSFDALTSLKKLDISHNDIRCLPTKIGSLANLEILDANNNSLKALPSSFGALTSLKKLDISHNEIRCLPTEIGSLTNLEILYANSNRLNVLPETIWGCVSLFAINFSSNDLMELSETFGNLISLEALDLSNNRLRSLPSSLFKTCVRLTFLNLQRTQITMDILRQVDGWEEFEERRRLIKQLEFKATNSGEGADKKR